MFLQFVYGLLVLAAVVWGLIGLAMLISGGLFLLSKGLCAMDSQNLKFLEWQLRAISRLKKTPLKYVMGGFFSREEKFIADHLLSVAPSAPR